MRFLETAARRMCLQVVVCLVMVVGSPMSVRAQSLYDAALGTLPADQGWTYFGVGPVTQTVEGGILRFDTWSAASTQAGYARPAPVPLDRKTGFTLLFAARVERESQNNTHRAGFSVILLSQDARGIELGFWTDRVFAQADNPLFTHAEDAVIDSTATVVEYALTMVGDRYRLRAGGQPLIEGPVRDYSAFSGLFDPYETPDFIFFGDDTTSARATISLRRVVLVPPPVLQVSPAGVILWAGVPNIAYAVESSPDAMNWTTQGIVSSPTGTCSFTNAPGAAVVFTRVSGP